MRCKFRSKLWPSSNVHLISPSRGKLGRCHSKAITGLLGVTEFIYEIFAAGFTVGLAATSNRLHDHEVTTSFKFSSIFFRIWVGSLFFIFVFSNDNFQRFIVVPLLPVPSPYAQTSSYVRSCPMAFENLPIAFSANFLIIKSGTSPLMMLPSVTGIPSVVLSPLPAV